MGTYNHSIGLEVFDEDVLFDLKDCQNKIGWILFFTEYWIVFCPEVFPIEISTYR